MLNKNANVNSVDKYGRTPLHYACINGCPKVVDLLVRSGADASARDFNRNVPSFYFHNETDLETSSLPGKNTIASMMNFTSIYHLWDSRDFLSVILEWDQRTVSLKQLATGYQESLFVGWKVYSSTTNKAKI